MIGRRARRCSWPLLLIVYLSRLSTPPWRWAWKRHGLRTRHPAALPFAACLMPPASGSCGCRQHPPHVRRWRVSSRLLGGRTWKPLLCASPTGQPRISFPCPAKSRAAGDGVDVLRVDGIMSWHAIRASSTMSSSTCHRSSRASCAERVSIDEGDCRL